MIFFFKTLFRIILNFKNSTFFGLSVPCLYLSVLCICLFKKWYLFHLNLFSAVVFPTTVLHMLRRRRYDEEIKNEELPWSGGEQKGSQEGQAAKSQSGGYQGSGDVSQASPNKDRCRGHWWQPWNRRSQTVRAACQGERWIYPLYVSPPTLRKCHETSLNVHEETVLFKCTESGAINFWWEWTFLIWEIGDQKPLIQSQKCLFPKKEQGLNLLLTSCRKTIKRKE